MKVIIQNIIINSNSLILVNSSGGQHIVSIDKNLTTAQSAWVDNIIACATSLATEIKENEFKNDNLSDWDTTVSDGLGDLDLFDFEIDLQIMITKTETRLGKRKHSLAKRPYTTLGQYLRLRRTT